MLWGQVAWVCNVTVTENVVVVNDQGGGQQERAVFPVVTSHVQWIESLRKVKEIVNGTLTLLYNMQYNN